MTTRRERSVKRESGVTVIIVIVLLLLMSALVLSSIRHAGDESSAGARARATARALHAADGGLQIALGNLIQTPANTAAIDTAIAGISVQSRTRDQNAPQALGSAGPGAPPEGYGLNEGAVYSTEIFVVDITAESGAGSTVEVQGKVSRFTAIPDGY